jgi:hypothetical protein
MRHLVVKRHLQLKLTRTRKRRRIRARRCQGLALRELRGDPRRGICFCSRIDRLFIATSSRAAHRGILAVDVDICIVVVRTGRAEKVDAARLTRSWGYGSAACASIIGRRVPRVWCGPCVQQSTRSRNRDFPAACGLVTSRASRNRRVVNSLLAIRPGLFATRTGRRWRDVGSRGRRRSKL